MDNEYIVSIPPHSKKSPFRITLAGITYENPNYTITRNNSKVFTVEYVISGRGHIEADGKYYTAEAGDTYIFNYGMNLHYYSDRQEPWKKIWFNAQGAMLGECARLYLTEGQIVFPDTDTKGCMEKILRICENKGLSGDEISRRIAPVYIELLSQIAEKQGREEKASEEAVTLKSYIDMHIEERISVKTLSELIYRSESQTIRIFKQNYKKTPYEYLLDGKINRAKILMTNTNISVKETAYRLGFSDEHYFSGIFRKKTGFSPTEYRKQG